MPANNNNNVGSWHLDKKVTIGHLVTTIACLVTALLYVTDVNKRLDVLQAKMDGKIEMLQFRQQDFDVRLDKQYTSINEALARIEEKLDKKMDKR